MSELLVSSLLAILTSLVNDFSTFLNYSQKCSEVGTVPDINPRSVINTINDTFSPFDRKTLYSLRYRTVRKVVKGRALALRGAGDQQNGGSLIPDILMKRCFR